MYCVLGRCTVCYGGVLCGNALYTVCYGDVHVLCVMAVYCVLDKCIVC